MTDPKRAGEVVTARPRAGSKPDTGADDLVNLGKVMAGQQEIKTAQEDLARRFDAIEAAWRGVQTEHATTQSQVIHLQKCVDDLLAQQTVTQKMISRLGKLAPVLFGLYEIVRFLAGQIPHH